MDLRKKIKKASIGLAALAGTTGLVVVLLLASANVSAQNSDLGKQKKELDRLKKDIEASKRQARKLKGKEYKVVRRLGSIDKKINSISGQIRQIRKEENSMSSAIRNKGRDLKVNRRTLNRLQKDFGQRLRDMYKRGRYRDVEWLLMAESVGQLLRNLKYLNRVAQHTRQQYERIQGRTERMAQDKQYLETTLHAKQRLKRKQEGLARRYRKEKQERRSILKKIRTRRSYHEAALKEKQEQYQEMQAIIERLEEARAGGGLHTRFAKAQGTMMWPVTGSVISRFGRSKHPRFNTVTFNKGVDIRATAGAPVRCIWDGKVIMVDWIRGYGKFTIVDHGQGYYTVYAHLSDIIVEKGKSVIKGQVIGTAGDTGSIKGTILHFELRKGKKVMDPLKWLKK